MRGEDRHERRQVEQLQLLRSLQRLADALLVDDRGEVEQRSRPARHGDRVDRRHLLGEQQDRPVHADAGVPATARAGDEHVGQRARGRAQAVQAAAERWLRTAPGPSASTAASQHAFADSAVCPTA
jgi:hypothetical protein